MAMNVKVNGDMDVMVNGHVEEKINKKFKEVVNAFMNVNVNGHINGEVNGHMNGEVNGNMNGKVNGHMNGEVNGHMNEEVNGYMKQPKGFATRAIHVGQDPEQWNCNAVVPPIFTATTYKQDGPAENKGFLYARCGNPTRGVLEECLANLDNGKYGLAFSSGMGATTCITSLLSQGDQLICGDDMYGGTNALFSQILVRMGVDVVFADLTNISKLKNLLTEKTKMIWCETPTNPLLKITDIKAMAACLKNHPQVIMVVDNTFMTSYFQRPLDLGAHIVMYSLTKYMNGHSDVVMGAAVTNSEKIHDRLRFLQTVQGAVPSAFDCYLVNRGLKTLAIRMNQHMKSSIKVALFLEKHPLVNRVIHPGLPSHPQHLVAKKQCYGHSGILSFYIKGGLAQSRKFLQSLKVFSLAVSLGGYESLAQLPSLMTHAPVPVEQRVELGILDNLIRMSIGLEDTQDIIDDIDQALLATTKE